jgi:hypothetical protein
MDYHRFSSAFFVFAWMNFGYWAISALSLSTFFTGYLSTIRSLHLLFIKQTSFIKNNINACNNETVLKARGEIRIDLMNLILISQG